MEFCLLFFGAKTQKKPVVSTTSHFLWWLQCHTVEAQRHVTLAPVTDLKTLIINQAATAAAATVSMTDLFHIYNQFWNQLQASSVSAYCCHLKGD